MVQFDEKAYEAAFKDLDIDMNGVLSVEVILNIIRKHLNKN